MGAAIAVNILPTDERSVLVLIFAGVTALVSCFGPTKTFDKINFGHFWRKLYFLKESHQPPSNSK